ncbi:hypothetical protein AB0K68_33450 [Streptomyces sp. NPDC050698]
MARRRWAAAVGLVACLLMLHLVVEGLAGEGRAAVAVTADSLEPGAVGSDATRSAEFAEAAEAGEPCPCEDEPAGRQLAARTPRAAGAAGASPVVTGAAVVDRGGKDARAAGAAPCTGVAGSAPDAARLQTFRC